MDIVTIDSQAYKSLEQKIDKIAEFIATSEVASQNKDPDFTDVRLETEEVCDILDVSTATQC